MKAAKHPGRPAPLQRLLQRAQLLWRLVVFGLLDGIAARWPVRAVSDGVVVVRLDAIGDFVLWLRSARHLRALYPGQRIVLVANSLWADLARQLPYWDQVIPVQVERLDSDIAYRWQTMHRVRRLGLATALQPTRYRLIFSGDAVVRATGARQRIGGADGDNAMSARLKRIADRWYTRLIADGAPDLTELAHNHQFLQGLGWPEPELRPYRLPQVAELPLALQPQRAYFIVFPGASWSGRQWPTRQFARLIADICADRRMLPVLCGSAQERALCADIAANAGVATINLAGQTSLAQLCELVRGASFLVGNETSAVHIAAAVGTPSVCLLGGGHFGRFVPYPAQAPGLSPHAVYAPMPCFGCGWACHLPHQPGQAMACVAAISKDAVLGAIALALASSACTAANGTPGTSDVLQAAVADPPQHGIGPGAAQDML